MAKGIGNGLAIGGVVGRAEVVESVSPTSTSRRSAGTRSLLAPWRT